MTNLALFIPVFFMYLAFAARRLLIYLHALQQDDYNNARLTSWIFAHRVFDKRLSALLLLLGGLSLLSDNLEPLLSLALLLAFLVIMRMDKDPRKISKKALVMTQRASRIYYPSVCVAGATGLLIALLPYQVFFWIVAVQLLPFTMILVNIALQPYEASVQKSFYDEARAKLEDMRPTIIAITGSFGKTSVKHILGHILKSTAPTLVTPGSVNTLMGITRIIREQLQPNHQYFIVEMGAYGPGSIESLCVLTPPDYGIITAIGHAHYERFKTLDTVAQAKFELAQAVLNKSKKGSIIVHEDTLKHAAACTVKNSAPDRFIICGESLENDLRIDKLQQTVKGLTVSLTLKGEKYVIHAPLFGLHHGHNIALSFAAAIALGIEAKDAIAALARTPQIKHRLEVKPQADGTTIIDDAFNSNPLGFRSALELLAVLRQDGRAILVTPGIVELGPAHDEVHTALGALAAQYCDIVLVINPSRIPTFISSFNDNANHGELRTFEHFSQAHDWLLSHKKPGDVILLENDLPDLYERIPRI